MLKTHKNAFFEAIRKSDLNPLDFEAEVTKPPLKPKKSGLSKFLNASVEEHDFEPAFIIRLRNTQLQFEIKYYSDHKSFSYQHTNFDPKSTVNKWSTWPRSLEEVIKKFQAWLENNVKVYLDDLQTLDLWQQIDAYKSFVEQKPGEARDTSDFSEKEKEEVRRSVQDFKRLISKNFHPSQKQQEYIDRELEYLSKAVDRLNRFDWRGLAFSTLMSIAVNLSVDTEKGRLLFNLFRQAFQAGVKLIQ